MSRELNYAAVWPQFCKLQDVKQFLILGLCFCAPLGQDILYGMRLCQSMFENHQTCVEPLCRQEVNRFT